MRKQCDLSGKARADQDLVIEKAKLHLATVFGIKVVEREQQVNLDNHYQALYSLT